MTATAYQRLESSELFSFMHGSHQTLEPLLGKLTRAVAANDETDVLAIWRDVESTIRRRLDDEERFMLPAFACTDREEATALLGDHAEIRELLSRLGEAIEQHYARFAPFDHFIAKLREHARREETLVYRWASCMFDPRLAAATMVHANGR